MKKIKFAVLCSLSMALFACNSGGSVVDDIQQKSTSIGVSPNQAVLGYSATGCKTISPGGSCNVTLQYNGTGTYSNQLPLLSSSNGYTNTIASNCITPSSANNPTCSFTITANSNTNTNAGQIAVISLGGTDANISLTLGGGMPQ